MSIADLLNISGIVKSTAIAPGAAPQGPVSSSILRMSGGFALDLHPPIKPQCEEGKQGSKANNATVHCSLQRRGPT